jgi:CheY-like chemotaxis protein
MEFENRLDLFDPGDLTALVCCDVPEVQRIVVDQLTSLNYKIHTGLFVEDILLKLRAHVYEVVVISENFAATDVETNPLLIEAIRAPATNRRKQTVVLVGSSFQTNDELQAFQHSVDLVVNLADVMNLRPVLRRTILRSQELYAPLQESLRASGRA